MTGKSILFFLVFSLVLTAGAGAAELDGQAIVQKMADRSESNSARTQAKMIIVDKNGAQRVRQLLMLARKVNNLNQSFIYFQEPPDVRGVKFLVVEKKGGDDDQRLFLPALKRARVISGSGKANSFMGSTFAFADLQTHEPEKGIHRRLADEVVEGQDCYVVESIPKNPDDYIYSKLIFRVRKDNFIPIRGDFYDKKGKLWKQLVVNKISRRQDGTWKAESTRMTDVQSSTYTDLILGEYELNVKLPDEFFNPNNLEDETIVP